MTSSSLLATSYLTVLYRYKMWNDLSKNIQESPDVFSFKKEIRKLNRVYVKLSKRIIMNFFDLIR